MKKIIYLGLMFLSFGVARAQGFVLLGQDSATTIVDPTRSADQQLEFKNTGSQPLYLKWSVMQQNVPNGWLVTLCDKGVCHDLPYGNVVRRTVLPGDTNFLHLNAVPMGNLGSLLVVAHIEDSLNPSFSQDLTFIVSTGPTATPDKGSLGHVVVAHVPSLGVLMLHNRKGNLERGNLQLYSLDGTRLVQQAISAQPSHSIDVSHLPSGIYLLNYTTSSGNLRQKVVINR